MKFLMSYVYGTCLTEKCIHSPLNLYELFLYCDKTLQPIIFARICALQHVRSVYHILQYNLNKVQIRGDKNEKITKYDDHIRLDFCFFKRKRRKCKENYITFCTWVLYSWKICKKYDFDICSLLFLSWSCLVDIRRVKTYERKNSRR